MAGHLDHVGGVVSDSVEVLKQGIYVDGFAAPDDFCEIGIILGRAQANGRRCNRGDNDGCGSGRDLPESGGASLLNFRVRRKILEGKDIAGRERHYGVGIRRAGKLRERLQNRDEVLGGAIVGNHDDQWALGGALQ